MTVQVQLKVFSEEDSRNSRLNSKDCLLTRKVPVGEFGQYVEELHAHANQGFREQFYVSDREGAGLCCGLTTPPSILQSLPNREDSHTVTYAQRPDHKNLNRFTNITVCKQTS